MRIIAGDRRGARITAPKGTATRPTGDIVRDQPDFLDEEDDQLYVDPYLFVNSSATFRTPLEGVELQVSGVNLLDAEIRDPFDGAALPGEIPGEGRSFWGEIRIRF